MRSDGFYWVKYRGVWVIAEYTCARWFICGVGDSFLSYEFDEIEGRRMDKGLGHEH